jgi:hypothetical protein
LKQCEICGQIGHVSLLCPVKDLPAELREEALKKMEEKKQEKQQQQKNRFSFIFIDNS